MSPAAADRALGRLLDELSAAGYRFIPPTPETHRRVIARRSHAGTLRDVFGWSLPFEPSLLGPSLLGCLEASGMLRPDGDRLRSAVRIASVGDALFLHSAFPTDAADSVFFGPDTYRFLGFIDRELAQLGRFDSLVDIGTGSGVGAIIAARHAPGARLTMIDINPLALRFARINAQHHRVAVDIIQGSGIEPVAGTVELAICNPPFISDRAGRAYRDGGEMHGAALSLDWASATASKLASGGHMLLYSASAIVDGRDAFEQALTDRLAESGCDLRYAEIDPDIFGEQLDEPGYEDVERIAAVGAVISRR